MYDHLVERRKISDRLHEALAALARDRDPWQLEYQLATTGIPASVVQRPMDVFADPQIEARGLKQLLTHSECGDVIHYGFCTRFSARSEMVRTAPPCLGEHNEYVLKELLGLPDIEIQRLMDAGAIA